MKIISVDSSSIYQSNSLNRGIQTFTSLLSGQTHFIFLNDHVNRLLKAADYLFPNYGWGQKNHEITEFLKTEFVPSHYFRLSIVEDTLFLIKKPHVPKEPYTTLGNALCSRSPSLLPAYLKNPNYLSIELELIEAKKRKCSDVVFFDVHNILTEASTSNVFAILDEKTIITPKVSSMVLEGVIRGKLVEYLKSINLNILESDISKSELESCKEIWLTNSIQGMRLVESYEKRDMFQEKTIYQMICNQFGRYGEKYNYE